MKTWFITGISSGLGKALAKAVLAPGGFRTNSLSAHSIRRSESAVADAYADTVGKAIAHLDAIASRQIGDPVRGAAAIIAAVEAADPPLHLLLGSDALRRVREKFSATTREIDYWEATSLGTDFPAEE